MPLVWFRSWRRVIRRPSKPLPRTRPGSHFSTVSSSESFPSASSCRTTVATNVFEMLATR
ncbi:hypothetical protein SPURM210S_00438 [Streptomyces purpurascens]